METRWMIIGLAAAFLVVFVLLYNRLQRLRIKVEEAGADIDVALEKRYDLLSEQIEAVKKYLAHEYKTMTDVTGIRTGADQEEKRSLRQQEVSEEVLRSIDQEIARQTQDMEKIKRQLEQNRIRRRSGARGKDERRRSGQEAALSEAGAKREAGVGQKIGALAGIHRDLAGVGAGFDALAEQYPILNSWVPMEYFQRTIYDSEEHLQAARRLYNANVSVYNQTLAAIPWSIVASAFSMEEAAFYEIEGHKRAFQVRFD